MEKTNEILYKGKYDGQAKMHVWGHRKIIDIPMTKSLIILFLVSILLGRAKILDGLAPFGIAFFITLLIRDKRYVFLGLGVLIGLFTTSPQVNLIKYCIVLTFSWVVFSYARDRIRWRIFSLAAAAGLTMFLSALGYLLVSDFYAYDLFMIGFESVIVFVFVYILSYVMPIVLQKSNRKILSNEELICMAIATAVALSGLSDIIMMNYSVKNIFGILLTLIFAYNGGASVGAAVGITIGIITSMSTIETPMIIGIYGFCGLLAGIFKDLGKIGSGTGMILGNAILTFYINGSTEVIIQFEEVFTAIILFIVTPKTILHSMEKFVNASAHAMQMDKVYSDRIKKITYCRLKEYANAFSELAVTYGNILEKNKIIEQSEVADIVDQVVNRVCQHCGMCRACWQNTFYHTYNGVVEAISTLEGTGKISTSSIPKSLKKRCIRLNELIQTITDIFEIYKIHYHWQKKLFESRQLVAEQFKGVADTIDGLAKEINTQVEFHTEVEDALYVAFDKEGVVIDKATVLVKENGKFEIEIGKRPCFDRKQCDEKIAPIVSKVIGKDVTRKNHHCNLNEGKDYCSFKLVEAEKYQITTGVARMAKDGGLTCGDSYTFIELEDGKYMMALSDGMGSGEKAAKESMATITLLEQLMEAGFDKDTAIKTINSILVLKSSEEMFATMDMSIIDMYTGKVEFVKIGSVSSFIKRANGGVEVIKSSSLPIGILNEIDIESFDKKLEHGDFVIMVSDGILDADKSMEEKENWIISFLKQIDTRNPQFIADELLNMAIEKYGRHMEDDATVLVSKIWEPMKANRMM